MTMPDAKEVAYVLDQLSEFYTPDEAKQWLHLPHPQLADRTPLAVIASGHLDAVMAIIARLSEAAYL
jgi:uncharacterized protein (DUF2384 family)